MKKRTKKLLCFSLIASMSIGCFNTEARVTKEVAEAVLPYLMEAAGIPGDTHSGTTKKANASEYEGSKIQAILSMIYTDEGQQQMVDWAVRNKRPDKLAVFGGVMSDSTNWEQNSSNINQGNEKLYQILFPCKTETFTSFANHTSRFGYVVLTKYESIESKLLQWIIDGKKPAGENDIIAVGNEVLDCKIARIIFILDIFDDLQQIKEICGTIPENMEFVSKNEYMCRPVSAIIANKEGDCVETLYRHLINISIQDTIDLNLLHVERLLELLRKYFGNKSLETPKEIKDRSYAGTTSIKDHNKWKNALQSVADFKTYFNISSGAIYNIARTLWQIAFFETTEQMKPFGGLENFEKIIEISMNKLADVSKRFSVNIKDAQTDKGWITKIITIQDATAQRIIVIGICEDISKDNFGHAEIISITPMKP